MQNITSAADLKNAIQLLEVEQLANGQLLKEQFLVTYKSFNPFNLLKSSFKDAASSPFLIDNIISTVLGLATAYVSNKVVVGSSVNKYRKVLGSVIQLGVSSLVTNKSGLIRTFGQNILRKFLHKETAKPSRE